MLSNHGFCEKLKEKYQMGKRTNMPTKMMVG